MASEYPSAERQSCGYAIQYMKWLFTTGGAHEVGPDATAILAAVVTLEDEFFYSRAVNFYNEQLMDRCGIKSEHALIRARTIAVDAGLLNYQQGKKRTPGRYFVCGFTAQNAAEVKRKSSESEVKARPSIPLPLTPHQEEKRPRFSPPTVDEVKAYCRERKNSINPDQFVDHYIANGWTQGKGKPIRDWKAAVRTWERNGLSKKAEPEAPLRRFGT